MTAQTDTCLYFPPADSSHSDGFTSQMSESDGSAGPVVRELIQNALDAAQGERARVDFIIETAQSEQIPGWNDYVHAFQEAKRFREGLEGKRGSDERNIIARIGKSISAREIPVMFCVDRGSGISREQMSNLLGVGNTTKADSGAGSFGVGHLAAFGASDLRYVFYASRYARNGTLSTVASGQAILSDRKAPASQRGQQRLLDNIGAKGHWEQVRDGARHGDFREGTSFPEVVPPFIDRFLPRGTGTVVAMFGFNDFRREPRHASAELQIAQIAASNFLSAIHDGDLIVTIKNADTNIVVDERSIGGLLRDIADHQNVTARRGPFVGKQAYAAYLTLREDEALQWQELPGVRVWWRRLTAEEGDVTRINVFRRGMWISHAVYGLHKSRFVGCPPFNAVINFVEGQYEQLLRDAEHPNHLDVELARLDDPERRQALKTMLSDVARHLMEAVGVVNDQDEFVLDNFAQLRGELKRKPEKLSKPRQRSGGTADNVIVGGTRRGSGGDGRRERGKPRGGTAPAFRYARRVSHSGRKVVVGLDYTEDVSDSHDIEVQVRLASGSDETCDNVYTDDYLRMVEIDDGVGNMAHAGPDGEFYLRIPARQGQRTLSIGLHADYAVPGGWEHLVSIDIVKRGGRTRPDPPPESANGTTDNDTDLGSLRGS